MMNNDALIITDSLLDQSACKTAHGLILGPSKYNIVGIIDKKFGGQDVIYLV
jgi:uncharacterized NAD-dependent epimerase/dehydratase family protein